MRIYSRISLLAIAIPLGFAALWYWKNTFYIASPDLKLRLPREVMHLNLKTLMDADEYCAANGFSAMRIIMSEIYPSHRLSDGGAGDEEGSITIAAIRNRSRHIQFLSLRDARHLLNVPPLAVPCGKGLVLQRAEEDGASEESKRRPPYTVINVESYLLWGQNGRLSERKKAPQ
jgi:hypothetical protein